MGTLNLKKEQIDQTKETAKRIADDVYKYIRQYSTVSTERTVLRLYGVDKTDEAGTPIPNLIVDQFKKKKILSNGVSTPFSKAMVISERDPQTTAELILDNKIKLSDLDHVHLEKAKKVENQLSKKAIDQLDKTKKLKEKKQNELSLPPTPWRYLIVATGNIYEDRTQAKSAVKSGADIIAVIRSTAQSLLDYVPYGPTTEGFGGTFATQENFKIMRKALDEIGEEEKRYIRLVNYSSGLCMAEIAACAALEDLDMLLNDSMYGILFRDINMKRTFIDQHFSRLICGRAGIIINTGEDNYLTTADAVDNAYTVVASDLINEAMAHNSKVIDELLGLGHAYEINPQIKNAFLMEMAHAQLIRQLFPKAPLKYMPPTKYKSTDVFFSHCLDTLFNMVSVSTKQGIHLAGILTEAIHTPLMQDRYKALQSINYVFNVAKDLGDEIEFKEDGIIQRRAQTVLDETENFLKKVEEIGLEEAISKGWFADIKRSADGGKGLDGVFKKGPFYSNPIMTTLENC